MRQIGRMVLALGCVAGLAGAVHAEDAARLTGAGASFPYPVYSQWANKYHKLTGMKLNYQSIGSGGGIAQIKNKTVDFGASDAPLTAKELQEAGLIQFPMVIGGVVPVINVKGIEAGKVKLSGELLGDIFLGKVKTWDDAAIKALNPDVALPATAITVVRRADGSGTTWIFTNYLTKVSKEWAKQVGCEKAVSWPVGVGGKGNEGVASYVKRINGSIGYGEYAYALQNKLAHVQLKNKDGKFVHPTAEAFQAAAANAKWKETPGYAVVLTDQAGEKSWPIAGASFILIYAKQADAAKATAMLKFFDWCYMHGAETAEKLDYVTMPKNVIEMIEETWDKSITPDSVWPVK